MNIFKKSTALFLFSILTLPGLFASHMMGGEITYKWLGGKEYELIFSVYRDCRGIPFNSPTISMFDAGNNTSVTVNYTRTSIEDLTPVCNTLSGPCSPANQTVSDEGVELHIFKAIVDFGTSPYKTFVDNGYCEIRIKLEQCCRNGAITTINPGNFYVESMMNICNSNFQNSSPQFVNSGHLYIGCNQGLKYNIGAFDVEDFDSLAYELVVPMNAAGSYETYTANFNAAIPMTPYCPPNPGVVNCRALPNAKPPRGFFFNVLNGDMVFTPTKCDEVGVISIKVSEYRKINGTWKILGWVCKDIQINVKQINTAANHVPHVVIADNYVFKTREKQCIDIVTRDSIAPMGSQSNRGDTTYIKLLNQPAGIEFRYKDSGAASKTAELCWTVHDSVYLQLQNISKSIPILLEVKDNYCPRPGYLRKTFFITVQPPDSVGHLDITTFSDNNRNGLKDSMEPLKRAKLSFKDSTSAYYINTNSQGQFKDMIGLGALTVGLASHPYYTSSNKDSSFTVEFDSTYKLAFGMHRKNGIYGRIYKDENANCQYDNGEQVFKGIKVTTDSNTYTGISNAEGIYYLKVPNGTYTLRCFFRPGYMSVNCPSGTTRSITVTKDSIYEENDFGISENPDFGDIMVNISMGRMRRGFDSHVKVNCTNKGNKIMRNVILYVPVNSNFSMKLGSTTFNAGSTAAITIDSIFPKQSLSFDLKYNISASKFNANDKICFNVWTDSLTQADDSVKSNNTYKVCGIVDAPYDPNDKSVSDPDIKTVNDHSISYTVRFQNTGTDTATRIVVTDTVDTRYLDLSGFELNWSDAPCDVAITGNILHFTFDDIMLPHFGVAGDKSIGSFNFSLGLKQGFKTEQAFDNRVSIFFDFEDPIQTNKARTELLSPVSITGLSTPSICGSKATVIRFKSNINIGTGNMYILEQSDMNGDFGSPLTLTSISSSLSSDSFVFFPPQTLSGNYKLRIRTSNPATVSVPGSGVVDFQSLIKPRLIISSNLNNYSLCSKDTLRLEIMNNGYTYKLLKNGTQLSDFNSTKKYNLELNEGDKIVVVARDLVNLCTDTTDLMLNVLKLPPVRAHIPARKSRYCAGEDIVLKASGGIFYTYFNNVNIILNQTKDSSMNVKLSGMSVFSVSGNGDNGCIGTSDTLMVIVNPLPSKPVVVQNKNTLSIAHTGTVKWYRDGMLLSQTGNTLSDAESGTYTATAVTSEGCETGSDPFVHEKVGINEQFAPLIKVYPNPAINSVTLENLGGENLTVMLYDVSGKELTSQLLEDKMQLDISAYSQGVYTLRWKRTDGSTQAIILAINR